MGGFDSRQVIHDLAQAASPQARFDALARGVAQLGIEVVNYGFFDAEAATRSATDIRFMTTMSDEWMAYYYGDSLADSDTHVLVVQGGRISPYLWGDSVVARLESPMERRTAGECAQAGLQSGVFIPMASPLDPFTPVGAMALAGSLAESEFRKIVAEHGMDLLHAAYAFHNASIRDVWMRQAGGRPLSERERDCLRYLADGLRQDAIADSMKLARVTVEMHLRAARQKLGARTLTEAVAKAMLFGQLGRSADLGISLDHGF